MKLVNFRKGNNIATGALLDSGIVDIEAAVAALDANLPCRYADILTADADELKQLRQFVSDVPGQADLVLDPSAIVTAPAALAPQKVLCVGLNYLDHVKETKLDVPREPILFGKFANAITASQAEISTTGLVQIDYEAELAVIMGRTARNVSVEDALDAVFGYANTNDFSERELQFRSGQWLLGKTPDGFLPIGPYLVTADEIEDPNNLDIRGWMNGELRQDSNTKHMIFSVAEIISYASRYMTLYPGDVIATGTPPGVILGTDDKTWMQPGDCYEVEIAGLGRLSNRLIGTS